MTVRVRLFAVARQIAGQEFVEVELPEGATVSTLREELARMVPALADLLRGMRLAVNASYVGDRALIPAGADVACIPPVSGG